MFMAVSKTNISACFAVAARFIDRLSVAFIVKNVRQILSVLQKIIVHMSRSLTVWQKQKLFCSTVDKYTTSTFRCAIIFCNTRRFARACHVTRHVVARDVLTEFTRTSRLLPSFPRGKVPWEFLMTAYYAPKRYHPHSNLKYRGQGK